VLPRISSNVSVYPTEPDADPLGDWLASLSRINTLVRDDVLVLPAHNSPFHGLHARLDQLIGHHQQGLVRLEEVITEPRRVVDVFGSLFARSVSDDALGMATGEALAHLNHLWKARKILREADEQGVWWWQWRAAQRAAD